MEANSVLIRKKRKIKNHHLTKTNGNANAKIDKRFFSEFNASFQQTSSPIKI